MKIAKAMLIILGVISIIMAITGLAYNLETLSTHYTGSSDDPRIPYFYNAFCLLLVPYRPSGQPFDRLRANGVFLQDKI